ECPNAASLTVVAIGDAPLSYQWRFGGVNITDATNSSLTISPVSLAQAGNYDVIVTNNSGSVTSSVAVLTVTDTIGPVLSLPANITVTRNASGGAVVSYSASALDACEGSVAIVCTPAAGSTFASGMTTVTCQAHDSSNNTNSGSFTVTVQEALSPYLAK